MQEKHLYFVFPLNASIEKFPSLGGNMRRKISVFVLKEVVYIGFKVKRGPRWLKGTESNLKRVDTLEQV